MKRTAETEYDRVKPAGPRFIIETVKVIRETKDYVVGESGVSIGYMIDQAIEEAMSHGHELLDVNLHFEREDWLQMAENFHR